MPIQEMTKPAKKSRITKWLLGLPLVVLVLFGIGCVSLAVILVLFILFFLVGVARVPVSS